MVINEEWSSNPDIVKRIFIFASKFKRSVDKNKNLLTNLLCVSHLYNFIGSKNIRIKGVCKCNCIKMKEYKISDSVKRWMCEGCDDRINDNSWKHSEYYSNIYKSVCKECYRDHWVNGLHRPLFLCVMEET
jgi:hypothetical protein